MKMTVSSQRCHFCLVVMFKRSGRAEAISTDMNASPGEFTKATQSGVP
jgi:hypothetical protein